MRQERLREDLPQIFQSCTFNRSVTSPSTEFITDPGECLKATIEPIGFLQNGDRRSKYLVFDETTTRADLVCTQC